MYNWGQFAGFGVKKRGLNYQPVTKTLPTACNLRVIKDSTKKYYAVPFDIAEAGAEIAGVYGKYEKLEVITQAKAIDWGPALCTFADLKGRVWSFGQNMAGQTG
jgi:hypothetical protein